jgi:hypothetical protein
VHRIWQSGLPIRWTFLAGEIFVFAVNVQLLLLGYRFFNTMSITGYDRFFKRCGTGLLLIALTAAILGRHWNETVMHHLDVRMPNAYRLESTDPSKDIQNWLEHRTTEAGPDLRSLANNPEFLQALRTQEFYKYDFDKAFQVPKKAVILGYKSTARLVDKRAIFVLMRFPADLAALLRFRARSTFPRDLRQSEATYEHK